MAAWENLPQRVIPKIALCLSHTGTLPAEFVERLWGPLRFRPTDWCEKVPLMCKTPSLPVARNILVQQALDAGATHLFWIDSDHVFEKPLDPNEALKQLYQCNVPIVAGLYRAKQQSGFNYAVWYKRPGGYIPLIEWTGNWISADVTGLGCCLMKREVFEKVPKPWFHWEEDNEVSEDFYLFEKAKQSGFEVKIFTDVRLSHIGILKVKTDRTVSTLEV